MSCPGNCVVYQTTCLSERKSTCFSDCLCTLLYLLSWNGFSFKLKYCSSHMSYYDSFVCTLFLRNTYLFFLRVNFILKSRIFRQSKLYKNYRAFKNKLVQIYWYLFFFGSIRKLGKLSCVMNYCWRKPAFVFRKLHGVVILNVSVYICLCLIRTPSTVTFLPLQHRATSSGTNVRTIVTLLAAEQGK